ncbi:Uncharacterised protein [Mycobacteroides abscessus subsp. abscessus]|nr:Uncharacterised protein [Mycobacteroides abscessus subsp. abscessus]
MATAAAARSPMLQRRPAGGAENRMERARAICGSGSGDSGAGGVTRHFIPCLCR